MGPENPLVVATYRKKLAGIYSAEDLKAQQLVTEFFRPLSWYLQSKFGQGNSIRSIKSLREFLAQAGEQVGPTVLTALFLKDKVHDEALVSSIDETLHCEDKTMQFIVWHDYTRGFTRSLGILLVANEDKEARIGMFKGAIEELGQDREELSQKHVGELEKFWNQIGTEAIRLLSEDPTGLKVLEGFLQTLEAEKQNPQFFGYLIPEFVIAGAELARDLHQTVYPQAASLYS